MIENGDFEKFPNQKLYLEWLEIKNPTQKLFEIISNIIVLILEFILAKYLFYVHSFDSVIY